MASRKPLILAQILVQQAPWGFVQPHSSDLLLCLKNRAHDAASTCSARLLIAAGNRPAAKLTCGGSLGAEKEEYRDYPLRIHRWPKNLRPHVLRASPVDTFPLAYWVGV